MVALTVHEAAQRFHELIERVANGEAVTIERDGRPIARITPTEAAETSSPDEEQARVDAAVASLRAVAREQHATMDEIRQWMEWGRQ